MSRLRIQESASWRLDDVYRHTRERWGEQQADCCITGLHRIDRFREDFDL